MVQNKAMKKLRVMIFGAGEGGRRALEHLREECSVVCILDNDTAKHGSTMDGIPVCGPDRALEPETDQILIASYYSSEIFEQLLEMGVDVQKIEVLDYEMLQGCEKFPAGIRNLLIGLGLLIVALILWTWFR